MATITVINTNDSGLGSLRQAIEDANATPGFDTIEFDEKLSGREINLTSGELQITDDLNIIGLGSEKLTVSGNNISSVFKIEDENFSDTINVLIDGLTITDADGNGIDNFEKLTVTDSIISNNSSKGIITGGSADNFPFSVASLEVINSTISDNTLDGIDNLGFSNLEVVNSTISGNGENGIDLIFSTVLESTKITNSTISDNKSGGITLFRSGIDVTNSTISGNAGNGISSFSSSVNVTNSTITDNTGAGISIDLESNAEVENTIIAGNLKPDISGDFNSRGYNIIGNSNGSNGFDEPSDLVGIDEISIDPLLSPLQDNGGLTQTHALLTDSLAIDAGNPDFEPPPEFDQRGEGFERVLDGDADGIATIDIGAYELSREIPTEIIDLTKFTAEISATTNAGFVNIGGFYQAIDSEGTIVDPLTGNEVSVGDEGYEDAALANSVIQLGDAENVTIDLEGGFVYVPYLLANGTRFFTVYEEVNSDGLNHVQSIGENSFGFEDLLGGGDNDFNDYIISFNIV